MAAPLQGMSRLPLLRQAGLLVGLAASVALGVAVVIWSQTPGYQVLYSNLAVKDMTRIADALAQADIPYKVEHESGAVLVPDRDIYDARLKLAAHGLPQGGKEGFELMDDSSSFGTSQFMEAARYHRAVEGELARTITSLRNVESARVHLALPKQSAFSRNRRKPSASVLVNLYPGRKLNKGQVEAVVHLVASSIPDMDTENVTVVDQKGRLLTAKSDPEDVSNLDQFDRVRTLEQSYIKRIEDLLAPIVGANKMRAQVAVDMDFTLIEQTQENYEPDPTAVRSEQISEEMRVGAGAPQGIPGALSNQPPGAATVPETTEAPAQAPEGAAKAEQKPENTSRRSIRNYELDRTISHTRQAPGRIKRISVAVVVDHRTTVDASGEETSQPRTAEEMARITALVREAVGFNEQRGDTVQVVNTPFFVTPEAEVEPVPEPPIWEQPWVWDVGKQVLGALGVLLLVFGVLRPVMRSLAAKAPPPPPPAPTGPAGVVMAEGGNAALAPPQNNQVYLDSARSMVQEDPKRVAQVVKTWVGEQ